jgi:RimJ/RimL family protein N-acetyltransferase
MEPLIHIEQAIATLKHPQDFAAITRLPVQRQGQVVAYLRPVPSELKGMASSDARLMSEWRNANKTAFFTWIDSTEESTRNWLTQKYALDSQDIIFMIETAGHVPLGHVALYNFSKDGSVCEFGRVLRGPGIGSNGGMTLGSLDLLLWATMELHISKFFIEVFHDNKKAISLYERLGFVVASTVGLKRIDSGGITRWEKMPEQIDSGIRIDGYALRMEATVDQLRTVFVS